MGLLDGVEQSVGDLFGQNAPAPGTSAASPASDATGVDPSDAQDPDADDAGSNADHANADKPVLPNGPVDGPKLFLARSTEDQENVNVVALTYPIEVELWDEILNKPMAQLGIKVTVGKDGAEQSLTTDDHGRVRFSGSLVALTKVVVDDCHAVVPRPAGADADSDSDSDADADAGSDSDSDSDSGSDSDAVADADSGSDSAEG
jgi:hypothetical protein